MLNSSSIPKLKNLFKDRFSNLVFIIGLIVSGMIFSYSYRSTNKKLQALLDNNQDRIISNIRTRMSHYENALIQLRAYLVTSENVNRKNFRRYVESLTMLEKYPGIQGLGYTLRISPNNLKQYENQIRQEGFPAFKVWPDFPRKEYFSIHFLEPFNWRNKRAFGYDMFSDATRREAMSRARDSGNPAVTSMVKLVQETHEEPQPGFLIYVPVYTGYLKPKTIAERREKLIGFVYAPFRSKDLFSAIYLVDESQAKELHSHIYDGEPSNENIYFDNDELLPNTKDQQGQFKAEKIEILGKIWTISSHLRLNRSLLIAKIMPYFLGFFFVLLNFLIFWIFYVTRMHNRAMLKNALELQAAVKTRDEFMALASHELKTPLTSLLIKTQLLEKRLANGHIEQEKMIDFLTFSQRQIKRLSRLIDNLLDVTRISSGKFKLQKEKLDFCVMLKEVIDATMPIFNREGIEAPQIDSCSEIIGEWDLIRIEQVITNLLTNAIRYGKGGPIFISLKKNQDGLLFSIRDQGGGIDESNLEKIFDRFERFVNPNDISGLGLGLYLSRKIVEAHGGKIWAESRLDHGTVFYMQLPVH